MQGRVALTVAIAGILRALFGYFFLIVIVRIVGRRPGKQLTPFEFVLIFFLGGLTLTGIVGDEVSLTSAMLQIITIACGHYFIVWLRARSPRAARLLDGTPLVLLDRGQWQMENMHNQSVADDDVMAMARDQGLRTLDEVGTAVLERNGEISIIPAPGKA